MSLPATFPSIPLLATTTTTLTNTTNHGHDNNNNNYNYNNDYSSTFSLDFNNNYTTNNNTDNSSLANVTTDYFPHAYPPDVAIRVLARFHLIAIPTIAILGILSNVLSFCVFINKALRRTSCSIYLAARSLSDTGFLLSVLIAWLGDAVAVPVIHTVVVCQLVVFSSYVFGFLSVWLVVCITLENYIRICHPFSVSRYCTVQKAGLVLLGLAVLSIAIYQFPLWTTHVSMLHGQQRCGNKEEYIHIIQVLVYVDMVITLALPSIVILFFMTAITVSLVRSLKRQSRLKGSKPLPTLNNHSLTNTSTATTPTSPTTPTATTTTTTHNNGGTTTGQGHGHSHGQGHRQGHGQEHTNGKAKLRSSTKTARAKASLKKSSRRSGRGGGGGSSPQAKVTKLLFAVSFTFLVLSLPSHIVRLRMAMLLMVEQASSLTPSLDQMLQVVFQILYYLSFAVNLMVYLSCGESFRNVFIATYITCLLGKHFTRRRSELSHTSYSVVRTEAPEPAEKTEEETTLIT